MNWGIIGYGEITPSFIEGLSVVEGQNLGAIASISKGETLIESNKYPSVNVYSNYEDLFNDSDIEVVYINTTNNLHKENVLSALKAGKNVLCEKPMGICKEDVEEMVNEAQKQGKFLMEGMWTKFLPAYKHFKKLLELETIGEINFIRIDFGFNSNWGDERRLKNQKLFGGTLLDNADYNIFLSQDVFTEMPSNISAVARYYETGVEDMCAVTFQYPNGSIAQLFSSFQQKTNQEALIYGDRGHIHLKSFWNGTLVELHTEGNLQSWNFPLKKNGFEYEIEEVTFCINNSQIQSNTIPHKLSIEVSGIMDEIIKKIKNRVEKSIVS